MSVRRRPEAPDCWHRRRTFQQRVLPPVASRLSVAFHQLIDNISACPQFRAVRYLRSLPEQTVVTVYLAVMTHIARLAFILWLLRLRL